MLTTLIRTVGLLLLTSTLYAQSSPGSSVPRLDSMDALLNRQEYSALLTRYSDSLEVLSTEGVIRFTAALYHAGIDEQANAMAKRVLETDSTHVEALYYAGSSAMYLQRYQEAADHLRNARRLNPGHQGVNFGLGYTLLRLDQLEEAIDPLLATANGDQATYNGLLYAFGALHDLGLADSAKVVLAKVLPHVESSHADYTQLHYNYALSHQLSGDYDTALHHYDLAYLPEEQDHTILTKQIQCLHRIGKHDRAARLRETLYALKAADELTLEDTTMFCFDQYMLADYRIMAFEKFAEPEGELYYKHYFYVLQEDTIFRRIQTENSPFAAAFGHEPQFVIGEDRDGTHYNYGFVPQDMPYDELLDVVNEVILNKTTSVASTTVRPNSKAQNKGSKRKEDRRKRKKTKPE